MPDIIMNNTESKLNRLRDRRRERKKGRRDKVKSILKILKNKRIEGEGKGEKEKKRRKEREKRREEEKRERERERNKEIETDRFIKKYTEQTEVDETTIKRRVRTRERGIKRNRRDKGVGRKERNRDEEGKRGGIKGDRREKRR